MFSRIYDADEIFKDHDNDLCQLVFPSEVIEAAGWHPGDTLEITVQNRCIVIKNLTKLDRSN